MKAIVEESCAQYEINNTIEISDENHHHLSVVMRSQVEDEILVLNGNGLKVLAVIENISKKKTSLKITQKETFEDNRKYTLALGLVKREYFEDILRFATELNIKTIIPIKSEFAQRYEPNIDRLQKIIHNSAIQSNALYFPKVLAPVSWSEFRLLNNGKLFYFHNEGNSEDLGPKIKCTEDVTCAIGPEGGWSRDDLSELAAVDKSASINLKSFNILRAVTAVPVAIGYIDRMREN